MNSILHVTYRLFKRLSRLVNFSKVNTSVLPLLPCAQQTWMSEVNSLIRNATGTQGTRLTNPLCSKTKVLAAITVFIRSILNDCLRQ